MAAGEWVQDGISSKETKVTTFRTCFAQNFGTHLPRCFSSMSSRRGARNLCATSRSHRQKLRMSNFVPETSGPTLQDPSCHRQAHEPLTSMPALTIHFKGPAKGPGGVAKKKPVIRCRLIAQALQATVPGRSTKEVLHSSAQRKLATNSRLAAPTDNSCCCGAEHNHGQDFPIPIVCKLHSARTQP